MNIAVTADGKSLNSNVAVEFEQCGYLLIINVDDLSIKSVIDNKIFESLNEVRLADEIIKNDCEAVITGIMKSSAFNILADAYITRFIGTGYSVRTALELMEKNELKLIKNCDGTEDCSGHHPH